jgi:hypothetical protein
MVILLYFSVSFCAVWQKWAGALLIMWLLIIFGDFLVMEVALEIGIALFYCFKKDNWFGNFFYKLCLTLKNLRNTF